MSAEIIRVGDKLHIMTRRLFETDLRRHFVGEVLRASGSFVEIRGYTFIFQEGMNEYRRLPEERVRMFSLGEAGHIVNKLPGETEVGSIGYQVVDSRLVVSDGRSFSLPINEFGTAR